MRKFLSAGTAIAVLFGASAFAADMPVKAPTINTPNWSGFYTGIAGGYGGGHSDQTDNAAIADGHFGLHGGLIGGGVGYNWQRNNSVFGVETDFSWADIDGHSNSCGPIGPHPCGTRINTIGTLRARLGQDFSGTLAYIAGGFAYGEVKGWDSLFNPSGSSKYRGGWTIGAGLERKFTPNWSAKLEYLYVDLGKDHLFDIGPFPENVSARAHIVRVGLNYYFDSSRR
jgi:outer membrane immunogenic protein